jgi:hypothetical protein
MKIRHIVTALLFFLVVCHSPPVLAQGTLMPSGPPAPTMKALDQVEPRTIVNDTNTPGDANSLFKITQPGSYYLTANLNGVAGKNGITITGSGVTLDLNGFALIGVGGSLKGINITTAIASGITIRNGTIRSWGGDGIDSASTGTVGYGVTLSELRLANNGSAGVRALRAVITNCIAQDNSSEGIFASECRVNNCVFTGNATGVSAFFNTSVEGCSGKFNSTGINASGGVLVQNCTIQGSSGTGILVGDKCRLVGNLVTDGSGTGISLNNNATGCTLDANTVLNNTTAGLKLNNTGVTRNLVIRNTASRNGTDYLTGTGNSFGPIINVNGVGDITGTAGANHPWANFTY